MIHIPIKQSHIEEANNCAAEIGKLRNSIREGKGNTIGCLGDLLLAEYYGWTLEHTYDYDLICPSPQGVIRIDCKSKERTVAPRENYNCTVANFNTRQECDIYFFVSILAKKDQQPTDAYFLGYLTKPEFYTKARFYSKGDPDPDSPPFKQFFFRADCYNVAIKDLSPAPVKSDNSIVVPQFSRSVS